MAEEADLPPDAFGDLRIDVQIDHQQDRALVTFTATAAAALECDRTLEPYEQEVSGAHTVLFVLPEQFPGLQAEDEGAPDEDVRPLPDPGEPLDITEAVRDTLLLALPVRRIAPGAEDLDIPTTFGALTDEEGQPVDPRWEALRKLRDTQ
ncbi:MAG: DUF177 domain-containing protein [Rhodothermales bacterium]|nr:DUF177 domain-containing protein [Rhodothermales bacterium]